MEEVDRSHNISSPHSLLFLQSAKPACSGHGGLPAMAWPGQPPDLWPRQHTPNGMAAGLPVPSAGGDGQRGGEAPRDTVRSRVEPINSDLESWEIIEQHMAEWCKGEGRGGGCKGSWDQCWLFWII